MKLRVEVNGEPLMLELHSNGSPIAYTLSGADQQQGSASVEEVMPGVFSVLIEERSWQVQVASHPQGYEVWVGLERHVISVADPRDRATDSNKGGAEGPVELRAQMPGKIVKLLAEEGADVAVGEGLIVVEAMKMQNEVKAPKSGTLKRVHVSEGMTVGAGDLLLVVE